MTSIDSVSISIHVENDLIEACRKRIPYETCGIVYGDVRDGVIIANGYALLRNAAASSTDRFSLHPEDWIAAYYEAQKNQRNIVGFLHSHPRGSALPSIEDATGSLPWGTYWIVRLDEARTLLSVYWRDAQAQDVWVNLPVTRVP